MIGRILCRLGLHKLDPWGAFNMEEEGPRTYVRPCVRPECKFKKRMLWQKEAK